MQVAMAAPMDGLLQQAAEARGHCNILLMEQVFKLLESLMWFLEIIR
jgi:hypothetical protein